MVSKAFENNDVEVVEGNGGDGERCRALRRKPLSVCILARLLASKSDDSGNDGAGAK